MSFIRTIALAFGPTTIPGRPKACSSSLLRDEKAKPDEAISIGGISSVKLLQDVDMTLVTDSFEQTAAPGGAAESESPAGRPLPKRGQLQFYSGETRSDVRAQRPHPSGNSAGKIRFHLRRRQRQDRLRGEEPEERIPARRADGRRPSSGPEVAREARGPAGQCRRPSGGHVRSQPQLQGNSRRTERRSGWSRTPTISKR